MQIPFWPGLVLLKFRSLFFYRGKFILTIQFRTCTQEMVGSYLGGLPQSVRANSCVIYYRLGQGHFLQKLVSIIHYMYYIAPILIQSELLTASLNKRKINTFNSLHLNCLYGVRNSSKENACVYV
jgi:hypothetical protein